MEHWNVWANGEKLNRWPLNEEQARRMARTFNINYAKAGTQGAKAVKAWTK